MNKNVSLFLKTVIVVIFIVPDVMAGGNHGGDTRTKPRKPILSTPIQSENVNDNSFRGKLINTLYVDNYEVSVKVVDVKDSIPDGGSHNILVNIKHDEKVLRSVEVNVNVYFPDDTKKSKELLNLGDWYLAGYDLGQEGKHLMKISFRNKDDSKHSINMTYP